MVAISKYDFLRWFCESFGKYEVDHFLGLLKACFDRKATREGPFIVLVHRYGVSSIIVSCYNNTITDQEVIKNIVDYLAKCIK